MHQDVAPWQHIYIHSMTRVQSHDPYKYYNNSGKTISHETKKKKAKKENSLRVSVLYVNG